MLHVGCADFASKGDWTAHLDPSRWLHGRLARVAAELVGVDVSAEAIAYLRDVMRVPNLHVADVGEVHELGLARFDVVVAGEIIEHLPDASALFRSAHAVLRPGGSLLVTTPNAYCLRRFVRVVAAASESVHVDHVAWYSYRTLARAGERGGFAVSEAHAYMLPNKRPLASYLLERLASLVSANLCEGIAVKFTPIASQLPCLARL